MTESNSASGSSWTSARSYGPEATMAAFPLGGVGTGNVSVGSRGDLRDWEIANHPDKGRWLPFTFFAIHARPEGKPPVTRVLESRIQPPYEGDSGLHIGKMAGLPRLAGSRMRGEYPLLSIDFDDDMLPVEVAMSAFTPLVPLDVEASGIPAALIRYRVRNPLGTPVDVTVAGSMSNPIGMIAGNVFQFPTFAGTPSVRYREGSGLAGLCFETDLPDDHLLFGSAALATADESVTVVEQWPVGFWQDGAQVVWDDFVDDGLFEPDYPFSYEKDADPGSLPRLRTGSLGIVHALEPGEERDFEFVLSWHIPNRPRAWKGMVGLPETPHGDEIVRNRYAGRFEDAWAAAAHLIRDLDRLETQTRTFHDALFGSTLPAEAVDAVSSTLAALRSTTCFLLDDGSDEGQFAAWEGSFDHAGSCEGTCTHVWNYAQSVAQLFPALERSARRNEFLNETLDDGRMRFRTNAVFGNDPLEFHPAVDGQLGTVVRLYREWRFSGDDAFLAELWPHAKRALDFAFTYWDSDGDAVLDSQQHNTYDIEFYGENSMSNSIFFAALRAGAAMAEHLGDEATAERYRDAADRGAAEMDDLLFNGEYYLQRLDDIDAHRYQYGDGCLSDQLLGQTFAHLVGLGHVLPPDHVHSAVAAIFRHNFRADLSEHHSVQRTYALNDESGLVLCSWPNGGRPRIPFVYSDEVWTGIEYQVATHLIYEGLDEEGLQLVRSARDRHNGIRRNPWNEAECGNHYARSMASWGVLAALTGVQWDGVAKTLEFSPTATCTRDGRLRAFFSTAAGWGEVEVVNSATAVLRLLSGSLALENARIDHPLLGVFTLEKPAALTAGETIRLTAINPDPQSAMSESATPE